MQKKLLGRLNAEAFVEISLDYFLKFGASSLTDEKIAVEEYDPERASYAQHVCPVPECKSSLYSNEFCRSKGADAIFIGVQSHDYSGYPDCRPQFIEAFQHVIDLGTKDTTKITLFAPFITMTKTDILQEGLNDWVFPMNIPGPATGTRGKPVAPVVHATSAKRHLLQSARQDPIEYEE